MASMRLCILLFGLVTLGVDKVVSDEGVNITCSGLNMRASFNEIVLKVTIYDISLTGCEPDTYTVVGSTVSTSFGRCAKTITDGGHQFILENEIAVVTGYQKGFIEKIHVKYYKVQCRFDRRFKISFGVAYNIQEREESFEASKITKFAAGMSIYESKKFEVVSSSPFEVEAYTPIHIQVKGLHNNQLFKFVTVNCFATATGNPKDAFNYLFFTDKCPLDMTFKELYPGTSNKFSFRIDAFTFIRLKKTVYFHCSLLVCKKGSTSEKCTQQCNSSRRRKRAIASDAEDDGSIEEVMVRSGAIHWKSKRKVIV